MQLFLNLGAFVPLTKSGNIVVDGVLASCYASVHHDIAHLGMAPMRYFPQLIMSIFQDENGFSAFVQIMEVLGKWVQPNSQQF